MTKRNRQHGEGSGEAFPSAEFGYAGLDIKLPALQRYVTEVSGHAELTPITEHLRSALYRQSLPPKLPEAVRSYYQGPAARGYDTVDLDVRPMDTTASILASTRYAHVESRIATSHRAGAAGRGPPELHTELKGGTQISTDGAAVGARARTARVLAPLGGAAGGAAPPGPALQSTAVGRPGASSSSPERPRVHGEVTLRSSAAASAWAATDRSMGTMAADLSTGTGLFSKTNSGTLRRSASGAAGHRELVKPPSGASAAAVAAAAASAPVVSTRVQEASNRFAGAVKGLLTKVYSAMEPQAHHHRGSRHRTRHTGTLPDQQVAVQVQMPAAPQQMLISSSKMGAGLLERVLLKEGYMRSNMLKIVDQLKPFQRLEEGLKVLLAESFTLYEYPPGTILFRKGIVCNETHVLMSGAAILSHGFERSHQRLQPGAVVGLDHMLKRQPSPMEVSTDPHFPARIASLSWELYEKAIGAWAAQQVVKLLPRMQPSLETRVRNALQNAAIYQQKNAGEALYAEGEAADSLVVLIQGQVLLTCAATDDAVSTSSQVVHQLRQALGPSSAIIPLDIPRPQSENRGRSHRASYAAGLEEAVSEAASPRAAVAAMGKEGTPRAAAATMAAAAGGEAAGGSEDGTGGLHHHHHSHSHSHHHVGFGDAAERPADGSEGGDDGGGGSSGGAGATEAMFADEGGEAVAGDVGGGGPLTGGGSQGGVGQEGLGSGLGPDQSHTRVAFLDAPGSARSGSASGSVTDDEGGSSAATSDAGDGEGSNEGRLRRHWHRSSGSTMAVLDPEQALEGLHPGTSFRYGMRSFRKEPREHMVPFRFTSYLAPIQDVGASPDGTPADSTPARPGDGEQSQQGQDGSGQQQGGSPSQTQGAGAAGGGHNQASPSRLSVASDGRASGAGEGGRSARPSGEGGGLPSEGGEASAGAAAPGERQHRSSPSKKRRSSSSSASAARAEGSDAATAAAAAAAEASGASHHSGHGHGAHHHNNQHQHQQQQQQQIELPGLAAGGSTPQGKAATPERPHRTPPSAADSAALFANMHSALASAVASQVNVDGLSDGEGGEPHADGNRRGGGVPTPSRMSSNGGNVGVASDGSARTAAGGTTATVAATPAARSESSHAHFVPPTALADGEPSGMLAPPMPSASAVHAPLAFLVTPGASAPLALRPGQPDDAGMPLYNALAVQIQRHKQQIAAVFVRSVVVGEEASLEGATAAAAAASGADAGRAAAPARRQRTALAMQPSEVVVIPRAAFVHLLSASQLRSLHMRLLPHQSQRQGIQQRQGDLLGGRPAWPSQVLRDYLHTPPRSRPMWQVEALADEFSAMPLFANLPWQARLNLFRDMELRELTYGEQITLAKTEYTPEDEEEVEPAVAPATSAPTVAAEPTAPPSMRSSDDPTPAPAEEPAMQQQASATEMAVGEKQEEEAPAAAAHVHVSSLYAKYDLRPEVRNPNAVGADTARSAERTDSHGSSEAEAWTPPVATPITDQPGGGGGAAEGSSMWEVRGGGGGDGAEAALEPGTHAVSTAAAAAEPPLARAPSQRLLLLPDAGAFKADGPGAMAVPPTIQPVVGVVAEEASATPSRPGKPGRQASQASGVSSSHQSGGPIKMDGGMYIVVSGSVNLKAVYREGLVEPEEGDADDDPDDPEAAPYTVGATAELLRTVQTGQQFGSSLVLDLAKRADAAASPRMAAAHAACRQRLIAFPGAPAASSPTVAGIGGQTLLRPASAFGSSGFPSELPAAELLFIRYPLPSLADYGGGKRIQHYQVAEVMCRSPWWGLVEQESFLEHVHGKVRTMEYKQGTELLRQGEVSPCLYAVISGECVLRGTHVGLVEGRAGLALHQTDLRVLKDGDTAGELSVFPGRPLWYSMVARSASVKVASLELSVLLEYFQRLQPYGLQDLLHVVALEDQNLYSMTVQRQALLVQAGLLDLSMFTHDMKGLIKHLLELGSLDMAQLQDAARMKVGPSNAAGPLGTAWGAAGLNAGYSPVVVESAHKGHLVVEQLARPNPAKPNPNDVHAASQWDKEFLGKTGTMQDILGGSAVASLPDPDPTLDWRSASLHKLAAYSGPRADAAAAEALATSGTLASLPDRVLYDAVMLRVTIPAPSAEDGGYRLPAQLRQAQQFDRPHLPRKLRGRELEMARDLADEMVPGSLLDADRMLQAINLEVHVKPRPGPQQQQQQQQQLAARPPGAGATARYAYQEEEEDGAEGQEQGEATAGDPSAQQRLGASRGPSVELGSVGSTSVGGATAPASAMASRASSLVPLAGGKQGRNNKSAAAERRSGSAMQRASLVLPPLGSVTAGGSFTLTPSGSGEPIAAAASLLSLTFSGQEQQQQQQQLQQIGEDAEVLPQQPSQQQRQQRTSEGAAPAASSAPGQPGARISVTSGPAVVAPDAAGGAAEALAPPAAADAPAPGASAFETAVVQAAQSLFSGQRSPSESSVSGSAAAAAAPAVGAAAAGVAAAAAAAAGLREASPSLPATLAERSRMSVRPMLEEEVEDDPLILRLLQQAAASNRPPGGGGGGASGPTPRASSADGEPVGGVGATAQQQRPFNSRDGGGGGDLFLTAPRKDTTAAAVSSTTVYASQQQQQQQQPQPAEEQQQPSGGVSTRAVWVRDALFDPSGVTNERMTAKLTAAARQAGLPPATTVRMAAPPALAAAELPRAADMLDGLLARQQLAAQRQHQLALLQQAGGMMRPPSTATSPEELGGTTAASLSTTAAPAAGASAAAADTTRKSRMQAGTAVGAAAASSTSGVASGSTAGASAPRGLSNSNRARQQQRQQQHHPPARRFIRQDDDEDGDAMGLPLPSAMQTAQGSAGNGGEEGEEEVDEQLLRRRGQLLDEKRLHEEDVVYVTMTAPPKPSVVPGRDQLNKATLGRLEVLAARQAADVAAAAKPPSRQGARGLQHHGASYQLMEAAGGPAGGPNEEVKRYVPQFLRSKQRNSKSVAALFAGAPVRTASNGTALNEQWVVPSFNSSTGFEAGMEADNGVVYYD